MKTKQIDLEIERLIMLKNRNELTETGIELLNELIRVKKQLLLHNVSQQRELLAMYTKWQNEVFYKTEEEMLADIDKFLNS